MPDTIVEFGPGRICMRPPATLFLLFFLESCLQWVAPAGPRHNPVFRLELVHPRARRRVRAGPRIRVVRISR